MKFFKPEDFIFTAHPEIPSNKWDQMTAATIANKKISEVMNIASALIGSDPWQWDDEDQKLFERFKEIESGEDK